ncbi:hypothetical protein BDQ17DRAFT_1196088, partial [Cyathus striatus]
MDIIFREYPDEEHIFVFDNASTHLKCADGSLSAQQMIKGPSVVFGVDVPLQLNGITQYYADGKVQKVRIKMAPGRHPDGREQPLYDSNSIFKGITKILEERGMFEEVRLPAECKGFKCE